MLKVPYDPVKDFVPISLVATNDVVIVINPKLPPKTPAELVAYVKANSGKMQYGSSGIGAPTHLAGRAVQDACRFRHGARPLQGRQRRRHGRRCGQRRSGLLRLSATPCLLVQAGKLRAIAMTGLKRSQGLPDVPTLDETVLKGFNTDTWVGLFAPAHTPDPIIKRLYEATKVALADPESRRSWSPAATTSSATTPPSSALSSTRESKKWGDVIRAGNIKLDE